MPNNWARTALKGVLGGQLPRSTHLSSRVCLGQAGPSKEFPPQAAFGDTARVRRDENESALTAVCAVCRRMPAVCRRMAVCLALTWGLR